MRNFKNGDVNSMINMRLSLSFKKANNGMKTSSPEKKNHFTLKGQFLPIENDGYTADPNGRIDGRIEAVLVDLPVKSRSDVQILNLAPPDKGCNFKGDCDYQKEWVDPPAVLPGQEYSFDRPPSMLRVEHVQD